MEFFAEGQEVLVVDGDEKVQRGLVQLLEGVKLVPTVVSEPARALHLAHEKFFAVALIDLDTPTAGAGVELIAELHASSPATTVLMMASRRAFDVAVRAFRAGAADVVVKSPDQVGYLKERVVSAAAARRLEMDRSRLLGDTIALHEELIKVLLETHKRAAQLEERVAGAVPTGEAETAVLMVDDDFALQQQLGASLAGRGGFAFASAGTGGEALDIAGRRRFAIALVKDVLPDLTGSMVVRSIKAQTPETIALLYTAPSHGVPGSVHVIEGSRVIPFVPVFTDPGQILERLDELREAALVTQRERRYLAIFRQQHFELLKKFADLRHQLQRMAGIETSVVTPIPVRGRT